MMKRQFLIVTSAGTTILYLIRLNMGVLNIKFDVIILIT